MRQVLRQHKKGDRHNNNTSRQESHASRIGKAPSRKGADAKHRWEICGRMVLRCVSCGLYAICYGRNEKVLQLWFSATDMPIVIGSAMGM